MSSTMRTGLFPIQVFFIKAFFIGGETFVFLLMNL